MSAKKRAQFHMHLFPQQGGEFTRLHLHGSIVTAIPHSEIHRLLEKLTLWSGWPVDLVLPADTLEVDWFDWWTDALWDAPEHHHEVRFEVAQVDWGDAARDTCRQLFAHGCR